MIKFNIKLKVTKKGHQEPYLFKYLVKGYSV